MKNQNLNQELKEWAEALENIILSDGEEYASVLLQKVYQEAKLRKGLDLKDIFEPSFKNTVSFDEQVDYPGDLKLEKKR